MPLHRALRGARLLGGADDLGHLGGRAPRHLAFQGLGQVQQPLVGHRLAGAQPGRQRLEAAGAIGAYPTIERPAPDADRSTTGAGVRSGGQLAHQHAALADGERLVGRLADERIAEERDVSLRLVHGVEPPRLVEERTLAAHTGCAQGELVLESRPPPVTTEASDHTGRGPNRRTATMPSTPMASTASENSDPPS